MELVVGQFMVRNLLTKILVEHMLMQDCYQWPTEAEIQTPVSFL